MLGTGDMELGEWAKDPGGLAEVDSGEGLLFPEIYRYEHIDR